MMRPMWGSSSATSAWIVGIALPALDKRRDVLAVAPELEQELTDVGAGLQQHEKHGTGREDRDDGESFGMLEHRRRQCPAPRRGPELVGGGNDRRNVRGDVVRDDMGHRLAIDQ